MARIGFGTFDVVLGVSMIWTGAGTVPGVGLIAVGLDQIATGSMNIRYGRVGQGFSIIEFGAYSATGNETVAILTPGLLSLGFGSWGSLGRLGARAGANMAMPAFRLEHGMYRGALMFEGVGALTAAEVAAARTSVGWWTLMRLRLGDVRVPAIAGSVTGGFHHSSIPAALLQRLANITAATRRESGLLLLENGRFVIRLGGANRINPSGAKWFFAHTHPNGNLTLSFRGEMSFGSDVAVLSALRQPWAITVGPRGEAVVWTTISKRGYNFWDDAIDLYWHPLRGGW